MKLVGAQAVAFCRTPDTRLAGALLHGPDPGAVAIHRRALIDALLAGDLMRLDRLDPAAARRDPAALDGLLRARGFFGGRRVVLIEGAADALTAVIEPIVADAAGEDAFLVVTAGSLVRKSTLRRLFENNKLLISLHITADAMQAPEIVDRLEQLGATRGVTEEARDRLAALAAGMDAASFDRLLETLATYAIGATGPMTVEDVVALAPSGLDAETEAFVAAVAGGRADAIGPLLRRVVAAGVTPVGLTLALQRHFRTLLLVSTAEGGPEAGLGRVRPPLWGGRRDAMRAELAGWQRQRLESAARLLFVLDSRVRSADRVPALALVERSALRLAMMAGRQRSLGRP